MSINDVVNMRRVIAYLLFFNFLGCSSETLQPVAREKPEQLSGADNGNIDSKETDGSSEQQPTQEHTTEDSDSTQEENLEREQIGEAPQPRPFFEDSWGEGDQSTNGDVACWNGYFSGHRTCRYFFERCQ